MKKYLIWSLSILLGMEPAVFAASGASNRAATDSNQTAIKTWIASSGLSQRSMTLAEVLQKSSATMPPEQRAQIEKYLAEQSINPQKVRLPKMDVTQYKDALGKTVYKLQAVQNGQSVTLEILNNPTVFAKINGQALTSTDMTVLPSLLEKLNAPAMKTQLLSAQQIQKLPMSDRVQYFKQLRGLLESMEAAQQVHNGTKTSQVDSGKWNAIVQLLNQAESLAVADDAPVAQVVVTGKKKKKGHKGGSSQAQAPSDGDPDQQPPQDQGQNPSPAQDNSGKSSGSDSQAQSPSDANCIAGGYAAQVSFDSSTRRKKCATDGSGGVPAQFRGGKCSSSQFMCNPVVYGNSQLCVNAGPNTTAECNSGVKGNDIPDRAQSPDEFNKLVAAALAQAQALKDICKHTATLPPGLREDQDKTCENFELRFREIASWSCANSEFAKAHSTAPNAICPSTDGKLPVVVTPIPGGPVTTPGPVSNGGIDCAHLPQGWAFDSACVGGNAARETCSFAGTSQTQPIYNCKCDNDKQMTNPGVCTSTVTKGDSDGRSSRVSKKGESESKWKMPSWALPVGVGLAAIVGFYYLNKSAMNQAYKNIDPQIQNPPVAPPLTPAPPAPPAGPPPPPTPRTVQ